MKWNEIKITTTTLASDAVADMLGSIGAAGVSIEDPQDILLQINQENSLDYADPEFVSGLGQDTIIKAYFPEDITLNELLVNIGERIKHISNFLDTGKALIESTAIDEEDWANSWKKYYQLFNISDNVLIKPSWLTAEEHGDKIVIELDPGMAFGTGTHETTKMCANLLEKYMKKADRVLDVGTGSGILSIIAMKLGAKEGIALDIDSVAVKVAKENAALNGVGSELEIYQGVIEKLSSGQFSLVVANIIADVIVQIVDEIKRCMLPGATFIASGIIRDRKQDILNVYENRGFQLLEISEMGEWVAMVFTCPDSL